MSAITPVEMQAVAQVHAPRECLTFRIGAEDYGIDILQVQEVRSYEAPTRIAQTQPQVLGVLNLRVAAACDEVWLVTAGIPQRIKG